jgi:integrase
MRIRQKAGTVAAFLVLPAAAGGVQAQSHRVEIATDAGYRTIRSNRIPERVTCHTFRHSFATHVLDRGPLGVTSPADRL